jgi:hypothetical protein
MKREGLHASHFARLAQARATAHIALALLPLPRIVARVRAQRVGSPRDTFDMAAARKLVSVYYHLRVWTFTHRQRCLLDSLTLLEFLSAYGLHPLLVFAVRFRPFAAHAWLQHEDLVLNGTPTFVRAYTPILVV